MKNTILALAAAGALFTTACHNNNYDPGPSPIDPNLALTPGTLNITTVMAALAPQYVMANLNAATGGTFRGTSGTRYIFPPNAFVTAAGVPVTGDVQVRVVEMLDEADMIFSGVLPISGGEPLLSGGEVNIRATKDGQPLLMAPGRKFEARMPQAGVDPAGMGLFVGGADSGAQVAWNAVDTGTLGGEIFSIGDTIGLSSGSMNWCNADRFMTSPNYQIFTVTINSGGLNYSKDSIIIHAMYDEYVGAWPVGRWGNNSTLPNVYQEYHVPNIPVHFVAFAIIKGNFYGATLGATPHNGENYTLSLAPTTPAAFKAQLKALK